MSSVIWGIFGTRQAPAQPVSVELLDATGPVLASAQCDVPGVYRFPGLAAGTYRVRATPTSAEWEIEPNGGFDDAGLSATVALGPAEDFSVRWTAMRKKTLVLAGVKAGGTPTQTGTPVGPPSLGITSDDLVFDADLSGVVSKANANSGGVGAVQLSSTCMFGGLTHGLSSEGSWTVGNDDTTGVAIPYRWDGTALWMQAIRASNLTLTANRPWIGSRLNTIASFAQRRGYWEVQVQFPTTNKTGTWPFFTLYPCDANHAVYATSRFGLPGEPNADQAAAEIDLLEQGQNATNKFYFTIHGSPATQFVEVTVATSGWITLGIYIGVTGVVLSYKDATTGVWTTLGTAPPPYHYPADGLAQWYLDFGHVVQTASGPVWGVAPSTSTSSPCELGVRYVRSYKCPHDTDRLVTGFAQKRPAGWGTQPTLVADYDFSDATTFSGAGTSTIVSDLGPNNFDLIVPPDVGGGPPALMPSVVANAINGLQALQFDGVATQLACDRIAALMSPDVVGVHAFGIVSIDKLGPRQVIWDGGSSTSASIAGSHITADIQPWLQLSFGRRQTNNVGASAMNTQHVTAGQFYLMEWVVDAVQSQTDPTLMSKIAINGGAFAAGGTVYENRTFPIDRLRVGAQYTTGASAALVPLGFYSGLPTTLAADLNTMKGILGRTPTLCNITVDHTQTKTAWANSMNYGTSNLTASGTGLIPTVSLPMGSIADGDTAAMFAQITAGTHDALYNSIFAKLTTWTKGYLRIGWEQNLQNYPWKIANTTDAGAFISAWNHIAVLAKAALPIGWKKVWNPSGVYRGPVDTRASYPGDTNVDVIGIDMYGSFYPGVNGNWTSPDAVFGWDMPKTIAFAALHNKPLALCECGAGNTAGNTNGFPVDDPAFPAYMSRVLKGIGPIEYFTIWDGNPGLYKFSDGSKPLEAAAWATLATTLRQPAISALQGKIARLQFYTGGMLTGSARTAALHALGLKYLPGLGL